jgi:hypothetical protein
MSQIIALTPGEDGLDLVRFDTKSDRDELILELVWIG